MQDLYIAELHSVSQIFLSPKFSKLFLQWPRIFKQNYLHQMTKFYPLTSKFVQSCSYLFATDSIGLPSFTSKQQAPEKAI